MGIKEFRKNYLWYLCTIALVTESLTCVYVIIVFDKIRLNENTVWCSRIHIVCLNLIKSNSSGGLYVPSWYRSVSFSLSCHVLEPKYFHGINTLKQAEFKSENFPSDRWKSISGEAELITIHIIMCCIISCEINYFGCLWTRKYEYVPPPLIDLPHWLFRATVILSSLASVTTNFHCWGTRMDENIWLCHSKGLISINQSFFLQKTVPLKSFWEGTDNAF